MERTCFGCPRHGKAADWKSSSRSSRGVWLGVCPRTDEATIVTPAGIVRAGTVKRQAIEDAWKASSLLSISTTPWTTGKQSKRHELTVENEEEEKIVKVDESEMPGDPRRFRITKEDIERAVFSDSCGGSNGGKGQFECTSGRG